MRSHPLPHHSGHSRGSNASDVELSSLLEDSPPELELLSSALVVIGTVVPMM